MNVIQQEAIAKSVGVGRDELAQSLIDKEALVKLSGKEGESAQKAFDNLVKQVGMEEAKKRLGDEQLANQFAQQSIQERFNKGIEKLRDNLIGIAQPILDILSPLMDIVNFVLPSINLLLSPIIEGFRVMGVAVDYIGKGWNWFTEKLEPIMPVLKGIGIAMLVIVSDLIMAAAAATFMAIAGIPIVGPLLAAAAAIGAISFLTTKLTGIKVGDVMSPADGKTQISTKEGGLFELSENDDFMAAPGLLDKKSSVESSSSSRSPQIDLSPFVKVVDSVKILIGALTGSNKELPLMQGIVGSIAAQIPTKEDKLLELSKNDDIVAAPGLLDKNDSIIAGTNLFGDKNSKTLPSSLQNDKTSPVQFPQIDFSPLMERINVLIDAVKAGGNVYLDATKVGTAMNVGTYKVQ